MNKFDTVCLLFALLANLIMTGLIYRQLSSMLDNVKQISGDK